MSETDPRRKPGFRGADGAAVFAVLVCSVAAQSLIGLSPSRRRG